MTDPRGAAGLDVETLLETVDHDPDLLSALASLFRDNYARQLDTIRVALRRNDAPAVTAEAHSLKGSMATLRGVNAAALADRLEALGRTGSLHGAEVLVREVEQAAQDLAAALTELIASLRK